MLYKITTLYCTPVYSLSYTYNSTYYILDFYYSSLIINIIRFLEDNNMVLVCYHHTSTPLKMYPLTTLVYCHPVLNKINNIINKLQILLLSNVRKINVL